MGTGIGSNLRYFSTKYKKNKFIGTDYNKLKIKMAKKFVKNSNVDFFYQNMDKFDKKFIGKFDGIIAIHTLCCFKDIKKPLEFMCSLKPKWLAANSLFYNGPLDVLIHVRNHKHKHIKDDNPNGDFNIHSLPRVEKIFKNYGYNVSYKRHFPEKKILSPHNKKRGSYTIKTKSNKNLLFSGPIYLPWYFIFAKKFKKN